MANANKPAGLVPVKYLNGVSWNGGFNVYYIDSSDTHAYAIGDPVATSTGKASVNGISAVTLATAGATHAIRGVIVTGGGAAGSLASRTYGSGFFDPDNLKSTIIPATKTQGYYVGVVDDPNVLFACQEYSGSGSTNYTAADIGKNVNLKAGTNNGYISQWVLDDTASSAADATYQLQLMDLFNRTDNAFGNYAQFLVRINLHELHAATVGV